MTLAQPMLCMVRSLIRCEHLSTPASRNLCVHAWLTRMTLKTLVGLVTCIPNAQIVALLHGVQAKKTTMEAGVLHTMAVMMAVQAPPMRRRSIRAMRHRVSMGRQIRLRRHGKHGIAYQARGGIKHRLRVMRRMLVMKRKIIAIQSHAREETGEIARPLLITGV